MDREPSPLEKSHPVFAVSPDAMLLFDLVEGRIEDANAAALTLYGCAREEIVGKRILDFSAEPESTQKTFQRLIDGETVRTTRRVLKRKDGSTFSVDGHAATVLIGGRKVGLTINRDITAALRMQSELAESERRFRQMAESITQVFWMTDVTKTRMVYVSPAYERIWGRSCASLYENPEAWLDAILPDDRVRVIAALRGQAEGTYDMEYRVRRPDGEIRWVHDRGFPVRDKDGALLMITGTAQDVTDRRLAEERLRESKAFLEKAQEVANLGNWVYDIGAQQILLSTPCHRILGLREEGWRPVSDFSERLHADDRDAVQKAVAHAIASGSAYAAEYRIVRPDGTVRWVSSRAAVDRDENGRAVKLIGISKDITEERLDAEKLKAAEFQLHESQKLEAVGRLAGGVAHDFNNILTAILGLTDLSLAALPAADPARKDLEEVRVLTLRAAALTRQLLAFSRRQIITPKVIDLDEAVRGVSKMLHRLIESDIKIVLAPAAPGIRVKLDPGQLEQIIVNLAVNARDAMPDGGTLTIATALVGGFAALRVIDTGTGMEDAVRARVFEPFFTTKEQGKGTGLGLATCYGIAKQNGGEITCSSRPGRGSTFEILLPVCSPGDSADEPEAPVADVKGSELVLVVEDEESVRRLITRMLRQRGFEIMEARDGQEGLEALARDEKRAIRLIISDMVMPRLGGRKLATAVAAARPDVRMLFISGYNEDMAGDKTTAGFDFLAKPFSAEGLASRVRRSLDAAKTPAPSAY